MNAIIGRGNTAVIYEWEEGRVLKLFHPGYSKESVDREFKNALAIDRMDFGKPKVYGTYCYREQWGILYEKAEGENLLDYLARTVDLKNCARYMAGLHKAILRNKITDAEDYRKFLRYHIENISLSCAKIREEALQILDRLPEGDTLCHGDFHPGNIIMANDSVKVIDFMNLCRGNYLYDVARTVFLVEYTPVREDAGERESMLLLKKTLADLYLLQMEVTRDMIQDYLSVIIAARIHECPGESTVFE